MSRVTHNTALINDQVEDITFELTDQSDYIHIIQGDDIIVIPVDAVAGFVRALTSVHEVEVDDE